MHPTRNRAYRLLMTAVLLGAATASADAPGAAAPPTVPDPSPLLASVPGAAQAGPPPIIRAGTRLIYYGSSASVRGARTRLTLNDKGEWVDKQTGKRYGEETIPGAGGAGYSVVRVGYVDRRVAVLSSALHILDVSDKSTMYYDTRGMVTHAGMASDYWVNPKALAKVKDAKQGGVQILRMPYVVGNRRYNAIRFQTTTDTGYTAYVYDLDSGLLIFHGSATQGKPVLRPPIGGPGPARAGAGSTALVTGWLVEAKQVPLPWQDQPAPAWVGRLRQAQYQGALTTSMGMTGQLSRPLTYVLTAKARGTGWIRALRALSVASVGGMPAQQQGGDLAFANAMVGGLWIPPAGLAKLAKGQVIETNPVVKTKTFVSNVVPGYVVITQTGAKHRLDYSYSTETGALAAFSIRQQIGATLMTTAAKLVEQQ